MTAEPKPKSARKKRGRTPREVLVDYVVEIDGWDWGYSLSLNTLWREADPYNEFRHLKVTGRMLWPKGLKTDQVEVSLLPSFDMSEEHRKDFKPIALGGLEAYPDRIDGHVGIPADALSPILQKLIAGRFKFALMRGSKFRYRSARLVSLRLEMKLTEDDMPDDPASGIQPVQSGASPRFGDPALAAALFAAVQKIPAHERFRPVANLRQRDKLTLLQIISRSDR